MANKIKIRRDTAANWTFVNPILAQAEPAYETDTKRIKFGDGTTPWRDLPYYDDVLSNNYITQAEFDEAIATVVGLSPETLNTLEELAGAINNDPQFFDNIQNDVDLKPDRSELKEVAFSGRYQDLEGTPNLVTETFVTNAIAVETAARTAAITSATSTLDANITAEIAAREQAIENEADLRTIADNDLQTAINAEVTRATGIEQGLRTDLTAETSARNIADTALQGNIDTAVADLTDAINLESSTRATADTALQSNIDTEATARTNADTTLQNNIDAETSAREAADTTLQNNIDAETSAREAADNTLQSNIDAETSAREAADNILQSNIDSVSGDLTAAISSAVGTLNSNINDEATTRAAADQDLQNQINNLAENIDPAALDSLTEIVAAFNAGDSSLVSTVNNLQITLQGNIDAEVTARTNADNALQDNIDAEVTARTNADTALQGNIDAETTAREAADTALQSNINGEAIARSTADGILQNNIDAETNARIAADELLDASITNLSTTKLNVSDFNTTADTWLGTKTMFTVTDAPVNDTDAANKAYVDSQVSGLSTSSISNGTSSASLPTADGDFVVSLNGGAADWTFGTTGGITFPDGTVQTTAYPSGDQYGFINQYVHSSTDDVDMEAVAMDTAGNSYVSYTYYNNNENRRVGGIVKLDSTGSVQWNQNLQSSNTNGQYPQIASLEYVTVSGNDLLVTIGTYYDTNINKDRGFMWFVNPADGSVGSMFDTETDASVPVRLSDAVFGLDASNQPFAVIVGDTYNEILPKTFTPLAGSGTDKLVVSWAEFNASGVQPGENIYYNVGGSYSIRLNAFDVTATLDGNPSLGGVNIQVSINQNGTYNILRTNGWSGVIYGWSDPVNVRVLGSYLGGVDGVNDLTFDFSHSALNANSSNVAGWASNIQGTAISDVVGFGWGGKDWSTEVGNTVTFEYQLNRQAYIARLGANTWGKSIGGAEYEQLNTVVVDSNGNSYVGGYYWNGSKASLVVKYDIDGNQQWAVHIDSPNNTGNNVTSIDLLSDGNLIAVDEEGFVTKINSSDGSIIWQVGVDPNNNISWDSDFKGTATPDGNFIFANYEDNDYTMYVLCVSGVDGSEVWSKRITRNFAGSNGEIFPQNEFAAQYIDCNATSVTIAASTYLYFNNQSTNAGLIINFPVTGENTNGVYGQYIIESATPGWNTEATTSTSATVISQSSPVTVSGVAPTALTNTFTATVTNIGGSGGILGNFTFTGNSLYNGLAEIKVVPDSSGDGAGYTTIELRPDSNATQDQYLIVDPTAPNHIHIRAGGTQNSSSADLFLGGEKNYVKVSDPVDLVEISVDDTNGGNWSWQFNNSGQLTVPGAVNFLQNSTIPLGAPQVGGATDRVRLWDFFGGGSGFNYAIGAEGNHVWFAMDVNDGTGGFKFYSRDNQVFKIRDDGALMFADATTQTTAYPGTSILDGYATESYVDTADQNLQTQIDNIVANIDPAQLDSLTEIVAAFNAGDSSLVSTVNNLQITLQNNIDAKANSADVYLKVETYNQTEIDNALSLKADVLATNTALGTKANSADVYTKTESDAALALKANSADVDTALALKANAADVYTQTQVDNALALKANSADVYTQTQVDTALALKADTASLAAVATSGDYDDLTDRIEYSTLGALAERTVQIGAGTLSYTPTIETGIIAAGNHEGTYAGLTVQNNNSNATSSANIYFSNTGSTETSDFAVIGLNGPNYNFGFDSVDGAKKLLYIANTDGDITLIPNYYNGGNIHLGYASGAAAISVTNNGGLSLGTTWNNTAQTYVLNQGTAGQVLTSGGNAGAVTWTTLPTALSAFTNDTNFITSAQIESFETDPVFESWKAATYDTSAAASITTQQVTNWDSAVAWGDHSVEGYLTSATLAAAETDPTVPQHVKDIQETDISNWNTAYGWGNHATAGYLTSATLGETDPIFTAWKDTTYDMSAAAGITAQQISDWNAVTTYGDHRTAGYLTTTAFNATVAGSITSQKVTNWDAAYSWGNHADAGYLSTNAAETMLESYATQTFVNNKVAEVIGAAPEALNTLYEIAAAINDDSAFASTVMSQIGLKLDASSPAGSILTTDITNWNTAYGWGNHADGNYLTAESDPIFLASAAADITGADITTWNSVTQKANSADVYTKVETDAALALKADSASLAAVATSGSYDDLTNKPTLFDGAYSNLTGAPTLATVATSGDYNDLTNKPTVLSTAVQCLAGQTTTVYTASSSDVSTIKLVIQVEQFTGTTEIQSSEVIVVRAIGTSTVMSAVYGTVYSGAAALATFAATVNGSGLVEVTCQPVGASTIYAKAVATEIKTED